MSDAARNGREVILRLADAELAGSLSLPANPLGIVVFAHGSGSSRRSPRNLAVAATLNGAGLATLLFDLLTPEEVSIDEMTRELRFDIPLLTGRLVGALDWVARQPLLAPLPVGLFGASTGAAAALRAAAARPGPVAAVVSRGGRPDLAGAALAEVHAPTLLIVGEWDEPVIALNRKAAALLKAPWELVIVPGATHLFEEPGTLGQAAQASSAWFARHLGARRGNPIEGAPS